MSADHPAVAVVGLGYTGLPLAVAFAAAGCRVVGVEIDHARPGRLTGGHSTVEDVSDDDLRAAAPRLELVPDIDEARDADAIILCVPTPLSANREPDLTALTQAGSTVGRVLRAGQLVVLQSTTYPGTTRAVLG